ncbi:MAG: hypothetical protein K6T90_21565 [Leptolyngbyaceae cyanobacterium HOT.MB2.61]|jgi:hypothetical protein|nr:hypothetical protein [Leptolyngbyaceae cyanobacterium HOT.MB2.61]
MLDDQHIIPAPQPIPEAFIVYEITHDFYWEVKYREAMENYCQWYRAMAEKHQQELQKMQRDINILGWFYRGWR